VLLNVLLNVFLNGSVDNTTYINAILKIFDDEILLTQELRGKQYSLFTIWFADENGCRIITPTAITIQNPNEPPDFIT
jgi:hypothetical protein